MKEEIQKPQFSISSVNWEKFGIRKHSKIPVVNLFCELRKSSKYSLRPTLKNSGLRMNSEKLCPNLSFIVKNK